LESSARMSATAGEPAATENLCCRLPCPLRFAPTPRFRHAGPRVDGPVESIQDCCLVSWTSTRVPGVNPWPIMAITKSGHRKPVPIAWHCRQRCRLLNPSKSTRKLRLLEGIVAHRVCYRVKTSSNSRCRWLESSETTWSEHFR
jgi:hypothetical protein